MQARDIMTTKIVAVRPDTPANAIAFLLLEHGISAVPVVDEQGAPIGMVSEGDLMPRDESEREARRDWWLKILAEGETLSRDYMEHVEDKTRLARQIMSTPVITVGETAEIVEVAELLSRHRVKRLPVVRDDRMVGIISRADLVRAVAFPAKGAEPEPSLAPVTDLVFPSPRPAASTAATPPATPHPAEPDALSADAFRSMAEQFEHDKVVHREEAHRQELEKRHQEARELSSATLSEAMWQHCLSEARAAARRGEAECLLFRFPCEVCTDHGRAVNVPDPSWPATLRGLPAQIFMRWKEELRPRGFVLHARVVDFPDGIPGHIGLFLAWG